MRRLWPVVAAVRTLSQTSNVVVVVVVTSHILHEIATPETTAWSNKLKSFMIGNMVAMRSALCSERASLAERIGGGAGAEAEAKAKG